MFDLENTLIASNVVESYAWLATRHLPTTPSGSGSSLGTLREAPRLLALDRRDRGDFLRHFYRRYEGAPVERLRGDAWELFSDLLLTKSFPAGIRRVREHRALGHRTLLITGALDVVVEPLRPLFDDVVCARLGERDGRFTGELGRRPADRRGPGPDHGRLRRGRGPRPRAESVAYADSASDLPMLEAVGHPVAVNPEAKLAAIARKRGWHVEHWPKAPGAPAAAAARPAAPSRAGSGRRRRREGPPFERSVPRFAAARVASAWRAGARRPASGRSRLADIDEPDLPGPDWLRAPAPPGRHLRQRPGHRRRPVVAVVRADRELPVRARPRGRRPTPTTAAGWCVEPVLGCAARGIDPPCPACAAGHVGRCQQPRLRPLAPRPADRVLRRHRRRLVGARWSPTSQLHAVPDAMSDEAAVHGRAGRLRRPRRPGRPGAGGRRLAVVIGAGTLGLAAPSPPSRRAAAPTSARSSPWPSTPSSGDLARAARGRPSWSTPASCAGRCGGPTGGLVLDDGQLDRRAPTSSSTASAAPTSLADALAIVRPGRASCWSACPARSTST